MMDRKVRANSTKIHSKKRSCGADDNDDADVRSKRAFQQLHELGVLSDDDRSTDSSSGQSSSSGSTCQTDDDDVAEQRKKLRAKAAEQRKQLKAEQQVAAAAVSARAKRHRARQRRQSTTSEPTDAAELKEKLQTEAREKRRRVKAAKMAAETDEERLARRAKESEKKRISRANRRAQETPEQLAERRAKHALEAQRSRAACKAQISEQRKLIRTMKVAGGESDEQLAERRQKHALVAQRSRSVRSTEIAEQRKAIRDKKRAEETAEEAAARRAKHALETQRSRAARQQRGLEETEEEAIARRARHALETRRSRAARLPIFSIPSHDALNVNEVRTHNCGALDQQCSHCNSLNFLDEKSPDGTFRYCCRKGTVLINQGNGETPPRPFPPYLQEIFQNPQHPDYRQFHNNIRTYNSVLTFASMGAKVDSVVGRDPGVFRLHGQIYHRTLRRRTYDKREYDELYVVDFELANKAGCVPQQQLIDTNIWRNLQSSIAEHNAYATDYRMLGEVESDEHQRTVADQIVPIVTMSFQWNLPENGLPRYPLPIVDEIAMIFRSVDGEPPFERDFQVYPRDTTRSAKSSTSTTKPIKLNTISKHLDPMYYVLFYPNGEPGWQPKMQIKLDNNPGRTRTQITLLQWKVAQLAIRAGQFNALLHGGKLLQQWAIDSQLQVESNNLNFVQKKPRIVSVEKYRGLKDHHDEQAAAAATSSLVLPSSFHGSHRNMREKFHDAIAIVTKFGKPDLFITMKCNPNWPEIVNNLLAGQLPRDRPDLIARVFSIKLKSLFENVTRNGGFGTVEAFVYTVKFEKQELPYAHILLILCDDDKLDTAEKIDRYICAEIPDERNEPALYEIVFRTMIHGPCGDLNPNADCMQNNRCIRNFPKPFTRKTISDHNGYTVYRRLAGAPVKFGHRVADNRFVIPYNKYLSTKYDCYVNVESCQSENVLGFVFKNIYKGNDCASVELRSSAECRYFHEARYISGLEAIWRLFEKPMHARSHTVYRLAIHLPNEQIVEAAAATNTTEEKQKFSELTGWFELNKIDEKARQYLYTEIPIHYVLNKKDCIWKRRRIGGDKIVSRIFAVSPDDTERFALRQLLHNVRGAQSFTDLRTVDGIEQATFKEAAIKLTLIEDDSEWNRCLAEASAADGKCSPAQLRRMFALICAFNLPPHPEVLFETFGQSLMADFQHADAGLAAQKTLQAIESVLQVHNMTCTGWTRFLETGFNVKKVDVPLYDAANEAKQAKRLIASLNRRQREIFDEIAPSIGYSNPLESRFFFIDGPAGSGKSYFFETIMCYVRGQRRKVEAFATTEIAASLLSGGQTIHSGFRIPSDDDEASDKSRMCIPSLESERLREASLLIVDEAAMLSRHTLCIIDQLLKEIMNDARPFGGKLLILAGDFRQTTNANESMSSDIIDSCLKNSPLWRNVKHRSLVTNMRSTDENEYNEWALRLGEGRLTIDIIDPDLVELPAELVEPNDIVQAIFGTEIRAEQQEKIKNSIILAPKSADLPHLNHTILTLLCGTNETVYASIDTIISDDPNDAIDFTPEFLHEQCSSTMPPHLLRLKVGAIIVLLQTLQPSDGFFKGTRLMVQNLHRHFINGVVITGRKAGTEFCIPRIVMETSAADSSLPFRMRRLQFPVRLAFAVTIEMAQGQTFDRVGVFLPEPVLRHGQLYRALTRARKHKCVKVYVKNSFNQGQLHKDERTFTRNIVIDQLLN